MTGKADKRKLFEEVYGYKLYVFNKRPTAAHIEEFVSMCKGAIQDSE